MTPFAGVDTIRVLTGGLKTAEANHRLIANNIANADTPNFSPAELDFQKTLRDTLEGRGGFELRTTRPRHLDFRAERPQFERLAFLSKNDYNKVDLDDQLVKLGENASRYTTYARLLRKKFEGQKSMLTALGR